MNGLRNGLRLAIAAGHQEAQLQRVTDLLVGLYVQSPIFTDHSLCNGDQITSKPKDLTNKPKQQTKHIPK